MTTTRAMAAAAALLAGLAAGDGAAAPGPHAHATIAGHPDARLEVDVSERTLYVYLAGELMNTFPVAVGSEEHPTPRGSFTIDRIIWNPGWIPPEEGWAADEEEKAPDDPDNPMVGAKLFFEYPDYYIHGTHAAETIGEAASHGCIRMPPGSVIELAKFVQAQGGEGRDEGWFERVAADDGTDHEVRLPTPIPIEIRD